MDESLQKYPVRECSLVELAVELGCSVSALVAVHQAIIDVSVHDERLSAAEVQLSPEAICRQLVAGLRYGSDGDMGDVLKDHGLDGSDTVGQIVESLASAGLVGGRSVPEGREFKGLFRADAIGSYMKEQGLPRLYPHHWSKKMELWRNGIIVFAAGMCLADILHDFEWQGIYIALFFLPFLLVVIGLQWVGCRRLEKFESY